MTAINRILIVDDEDNVRRMLSTAFALQGFETHCANNGRTALHLFADIHPDVVLMDIRMPEMDGIKALKEMRSHETRTPVILMTAYAEVETAVEALRCGAFDYVIKPFDLDELNLIVQRALQLQSMKKEIRHLHQALSTSWQWGHILTNSPAMMDICKDTAKIALSQASVLISGESGTGKELIARAIHYNSRRQRGRSLKSTAWRCRNRCSKVNCLVMKKVHLLVHKPCVRDYLNEPTKVLCSSTKLAKCRWYYKPNYYAFYRNGNLNGLAAIRP